MEIIKQKTVTESNNLPVFSKKTKVFYVKTKKSIIFAFDYCN